MESKHGTTWYQQKLHCTKNHQNSKMCRAMWCFIHLHIWCTQTQAYVLYNIIYLSIHPSTHPSIHLYVEFLRYASQLCRCQLERLNTTTIWPMFDKSRQLSLAPQAKRGRGTGYSPHLRWKIVKSHGPGDFPKWPVPWAHEFQYDLN